MKLPRLSDSEISKMLTSPILEPRLVNAMREIYKAIIARQIMDAIDRKDPKKIMEMAKAVKFLKSFKIEECSDPDWANILDLKRMLDEKGERGTLRELATAIKWERGLSQLGRMCRKVNFPLKPARQISRADITKSLSRHETNKGRRKA
jgi:hypothetical protein